MTPDFMGGFMVGWFVVAGLVYLSNKRSKK